MNSNVTILAFSMQKGGVGKTTSTLSVGANLAKKGAKVLLIDADPQGNLTKGLGVRGADLEYTTYEVLLNPKQGVEFATITTPFGIDLIAATPALAGAEGDLGQKPGRELRLRQALHSSKEAEYDFILIDTPPSPNLFTFNAMAAASSVIVPAQVHAYALDSMAQLEATIELMRDLNPDLAVGGIICTFYQRTTNLSKAIEKRLRSKYGELVFKTVIPLNTKLSEAPAAGEPIFDYAPDSPGALAYAELTQEVLERYGSK